jgi:hypothetical protein
MNWIQKATHSLGHKRTTLTVNPLASNISPATSASAKKQSLVQEQQSQHIAVELLHDNPYQPRSAMNEESLQQLVDTMKRQGF